METVDKKVNSATRDAIEHLRTYLNNHIKGQEALVNKLLIALLSDGHLLVEGAPGLAKTKAIKTLSNAIDSSFHRVQFTPDLLPSDITGTDIYRPETGAFTFQQGPIFHNLVLADEVNRAPAKVQSALLEAMSEHQVTIGRTTYQLPKLFMVMATQNPIEQEGTYPLPEAQLDRFLLHVKVGYPDAKTEQQILQLVRDEERSAKHRPDIHIVNEHIIFTARDEAKATHMSSALESYIIQLIMASREPKAYDESLAKWIRFGASPRGTISLDKCARVHAWLAGRDFVSPEDIQSVAHDVLRHRILLTYEAEAEGISSDDVIDLLLQQVTVP